MFLIYNDLAFLIFNTNLTFYNFFHLVAMLYMGIKKPQKADFGFTIYDIRFGIYDLRFWILDLRKLNAKRFSKY